MIRPGFRIVRVACAAALLLGLIPGPGRAAAVGPTILHEPVLFAARGVKIPVTTFAMCDQKTPDQACTARIFYRASSAGTPAELLGNGDPAWPSLQMGRDPGINVGTQSVYSFFVELPATVADTRGVDYIIKVTDGSVSSYSPGPPAASGIGQTNGVRTSAWHILITAPSVVLHAPVATANFRSAISIRADATCSGKCTGTLFFRRTGLLQPSALDTDDPPYNPAEGSDVQWAGIAMTATATAANPTTDGYGLSDYTFTADIPAAYVDTRGVDYAIKVTDGQTRSWWPGTGWNGYVAPTDGARIGWWHVHVLSPVIAVHRQTTYSTSRNTAVPLTVDALCWTWSPPTNSCSASVDYHSFGGGIQTAPMAVQDVRYVPNTTAAIITWAITISADKVQTPSLSYRFKVSDGYTNAYSPGTFYNGYYVKADGQPVGEYTVGVL